MTFERLYNVQMANPTPLYLSYNPDLREMFWTTDPEADIPYVFEDREEAEAIAEEFGGEVFEFRRPIRSSYFTGHNSAARLERRLSPIAAE